MAQPAARLSISVPRELAERVRQRVGDRGLSSFVTNALQHEPEREQLAGCLAELDEELGPVSKTELARARCAWPKC